jgi:hypothetical protein
MLRPRPSSIVLFISITLTASDAVVAEEKKPVECRLPFPAEASWKVLARDAADEKDPTWRHCVSFAMTPPGQFVCAVADGVVEFVREDERGPTDRHADDNKIVLRHEDGSISEYANLQRDGALVEAGERVVAGDVIGLSGDTGKAASPRLTFTLRKHDKDSPSVPCRFVEIPEDGAPKADQTATSQNVAVRFVPGWRAARDAVDFYKMCVQMGAVSVAMPLLENSKKSPPKLAHPSITAVLAERDEALEAHRIAAGEEAVRLKTAKEARDFDALAEMATLGVLDFADVPALVKELKALPAAFGKDPAWAESVGRTAARLEFRKLVADAVKEQTSAAARFIQKKNDPKARPDYSAAIVAWDKARARAPEQDIGSLIRRHAEALAKAR